MVYYHELECDEASMPGPARDAWLAWYASTPDAPCIAICSTSHRFARRRSAWVAPSERLLELPARPTCWSSWHATKIGDLSRELGGQSLRARQPAASFSPHRTDPALRS